MAKASQGCHFLSPWNWMACQPSHFQQQSGTPLAAALKARFSLDPLERLIAIM